MKNSQTKKTNAPLIFCYWRVTTLFRTFDVKLFRRSIFAGEPKAVAPYCFCYTPARMSVTTERQHKYKSCIISGQSRTGMLILLAFSRRDGL